MDHDNTLPPIPQDPQQSHDTPPIPPQPIQQASDNPPIPPPQPILPANPRSDTSHVSVVLAAPPRPTSTFAAEKSPFDDADTSARGSTPPDHGRREGGSVHVSRELATRRTRTTDTHGSARPLDWIVPVEEKEEMPTIRQSSVGERLQPTIDVAVLEKAKYEKKAKYTGWALNIAIGLQIALGALTTSLSAATTGRQTSIAVSIIGAMSTLVASYLARARGTHEPELSIARCKDLDKFLRETHAFQLDKGHTMTNEFDEDLGRFRRQFEELLGNANGERKLSPV